MRFRWPIVTFWWRRLICMMLAMLPNWQRRVFIRLMVRGGLGTTVRGVGWRVSSRIIRVLFMRHRSGGWVRLC